MRQSYFSFKTKVALLVSVIVLLIVAFDIYTDPIRKASGITPKMNRKEVDSLLGNSIGSVADTPFTIVFYRSRFTSAGPIRVAFDPKGQAVMLKLWEDKEPDWDIRNEK